MTARARALEDAGQLAMGWQAEPANDNADAPRRRRWPPLGRTVAEALEAGERLTVHHRRGEYHVELDLPTKLGELTLDARGLSIRGERGALDVPWSSVYLVDGEGESGPYRCADPSRLYRLPLELARELAEQREITDRDNCKILDPLRRALKRPELFNGAAYAVPSWLDPERARDTERRIAMWPNASEPHADPSWGPWCPDYGKGSREEHPGYRATLEQLGMRLGDDGRMYVEPVRDLEFWRAQLLALDHAPAYLNGVPVTALPCRPRRYRVAVAEYTAAVGLGTGARQRRELVMSLGEAAAFVHAGRFPHWQYNRATDRWTEVQ